MIPLKKFLSCVDENEERIHGYQEGHSGKDGVSDCIGLIIGALELAGMKWTGTHGCNWTKRNGMATFERLNGIESTFVGQIVYKSREPGEPKYALPDHYKNSGDLRDYYHVGVVTSVNPFVISHCSTGGMNYDTKLGAWAWGGKLKYVDYDEGGSEMEPIYQATVHADNDYPVKMRAQASPKADVLAKIPQGTIVDVLGIVGSYEGDWAFILYGDKTGYMMNQFLIPEMEGPVGDPEEEECIPISREEIETWVDVLEEMARDIREKLGRG